MDVLVAWLSERDQNGVFANAIASKKYPKEAAIRCIDDTRINEKNPKITVYKVVDKWRGMTKIYTAIRNRAETTGWGLDLTRHELVQIANRKTGGTYSIKEHIFKSCPWYYDYEILFSYNPNVTAPFLSESGQPDRINAKPPGHDDEEAPEDKQEEVEKEEEDDEAIAWEASPVRAFREFSFEDFLDPKEPLEGDNQKPPLETSTPLQITTTTITKKASTPIATATPVTAVKTTVAVPKTKRKRPAKPVVEVYSDEDEERSAKKAKGRQQQRNIADAMVEVEHLRDKARRRKEEAHRGRFEAEQRQRDQQYEILLQQGKERLMRQEEALLRLKLQLRLREGGE